MHIYFIVFLSEHSKHINIYTRLKHQSLNRMSNALDHSTTSAILKYSFNSRSVTLSRKENLEIDICLSVCRWYIYTHYYNLTAI